MAFAFKFRRNGSRNYPEGMLPEFNGTESMTPKLSVADARFGHHQQTMPIPSQPPSSPTTPTFLSTSPPPPMAAVTHNHDSEDNVATTRHQATSASHSDQDGRCHIAVGDVATKRRTTTMSSFVVSVDLITVSTPLLRPKATR